MLCGYMPRLVVMNIRSVARMSLNVKAESQCVAVSASALAGVCMALKHLLSQKYYKDR